MVVARRDGGEIEIRPPVAADDHEFPVQQQGTTNSVGQAGQLRQLSGDDPTRAAWRPRCISRR